MVELIGILAILVILVSFLLPRLSQRGQKPDVIQTIKAARVDDVLINVQAIKAATLSHCAQFGSLASRNGTPLAFTTSYDHYDSILIGEGSLDKPFAVRVGSGSTVRLVRASTVSYDLSGTGRNDVAGASCVVEAVIFGVADAEAKAINDLLDGPALGAGADGKDTRGRVTYNPAVREVHIYITHQ